MDALKIVGGIRGGRMHVPANPTVFDRGPFALADVSVTTETELARLNLCVKSDGADSLV